MQVILTPAEMNQADRRTIDAGTSFGALVERAGRSAARVVLSELGGAYGRSAVIICGPGNNGADGRIAAQVLRARGVRCAIFELSVGLDRSAVEREIRRCDVLVDAMYGTGFHGSLEGDAEWVAGLTNGGATLGFDSFRVVAIDLPSGVHGLTGVALGAAVKADRTVTFGALKPGLLFEPGRGLAGVVTLADIGVEVAQSAGVGLGLVGEEDLGEWLPSRSANDHKWSLGPVMVIGGSPGMHGAAQLGGAAALRSGSGVVVLYCPDSSSAESPAESAPQGGGQSGESLAESLRHGGGQSGESLAESLRHGWEQSRESFVTRSNWGSELITRSVPLDAQGRLNSDSAESLIADAERFSAVLIGPGLGARAGIKAFVKSLLLGITGPIVLDADGLNALAGDISTLRVRAESGHGPVILTPHEGEFNCLFGEVGLDRVAGARRLASESRATVLLKGPTTVIAEPGGRAYLVDSGGPWLATAGSGDVLAGIIAAFLASGLPTGQAASAGAWLHCRASDFAGHTCLVASDLLASIPAAWRSVLHY